MIDGWWWIDYLENEIEPELERDLQLLLEHSQEDRDSFESFRLLCEWLRGSDPVGAWPLEARSKRVRENVMVAIGQLAATEEAPEHYRANFATKSLSF